MVMEKYHATTKYSIESFITTQPLNITIHQRLITSLNSWRNDFVYYIFQVYNTINYRQHKVIKMCVEISGKI